ncbi:lytic murein transglycosylase [Aristophania vespae]|uniref:lytic murein transglycosylase n=1 Tax=Aristophania vespae TaxID=2697033 RepID=UPI0023511403|nr:lytic murein transglycosylase [Aristophania vespae]UMM63344.1 Tn3 family transposase TnXax1 [Aristophania vespae]
MERRNFLSLLAAGSLSIPVMTKAGPVMSSPGNKAMTYRSFLQSVRAQAIARNVPEYVIEQALMSLSAPNQKVLDRSRHQPEFTLTWEQYQQRVLGAQRFQKGVQTYSEVSKILEPIAQQYQCDSSIIMGIWGLESSFGQTQGKFNVIDALASLAYAGRRKKFFRSELLKALTILGRGDISPELMLGSYAGAMGQPQFMPSAYLRFGADGNGDGKKDIWNSLPDVFASIANYLSHSGWKFGQPWGEQVIVPIGEDGRFVSLGSKNYKQAQSRSISEWVSLGVTRPDGSALDETLPSARLIQPDGAGTEAFLAYSNFRAIRAYNPSDYYALAVGILGQRSTELRSF